MPDVDALVDRMRQNPRGIRFADLCRVCDHYFGPARQGSTSHRVYAMPWQGDPRVNIQDSKGMAKAYQIRQVLRAIERLEHDRDEE
jgi:hypothetical protein